MLTILKRIIRFLRELLHRGSDSQTAALSEYDKQIDLAWETIDQVTEAFSSPWGPDVSTGVRAVFGRWANVAVKHLEAIIFLTQTRRLSLLAEDHFRKIVEILLQVIYLASFQGDERERMAEKVSAWGCVDFIEKLETVKEHPSVKLGYEEMLERLKLYDQELVSEIRAEMKKGNRYWFGRSPSRLAKEVSQEGEDLQAIYHLVAAQFHGSWDVTLGVSNPKSGILDFNEFPDEESRDRNSSMLLEDSTNYLLRLWNTMAEAVGGKRVTNDSTEDTEGKSG